MRSPKSRRISSNQSLSQRPASIGANVHRLPTRPRASGKVYIVGAGPGDPELLTRKAARLLAEADTIVHDRLIGPEVLDLAGADAERVDVGKRRAAHTLPQEAINALLLERARAGRTVVRLKGGDPYIFARGGEEVDYLRRHGVAVEVVPGVTAALAGAARAEIPLTHRDIAGTITLVTAEVRPGGAAPDWPTLARLKGTLAFYMGLARAEDIATNLTRHGLSAATPVAIVENATLAGERRITGRLAELPRLVRDHDVRSPALIIVGEVVAKARGGGEPAERPVVAAIAGGGV